MRWANNEASMGVDLFPKAPLATTLIAYLHAPFMSCGYLPCWLHCIPTEQKGGGKTFRGIYGRCKKLDPPSSRHASCRSPLHQSRTSACSLLGWCNLFLALAHNQSMFGRVRLVFNRSRSNMDWLYQLDVILMQRPVLNQWFDAFCLITSGLPPALPASGLHR